jgi:uncharacterized membrane protein
MGDFYDIILFLHVMSFVFMSIPLFNLIVVNERALLGIKFNYYADRYMENIIRHGASRCFVFQASVFITGILLLVFGDLGIEELWSNWIIIAKIILLLVLMSMLSFVHFRLQPKIEQLMSTVSPDSQFPDDFVGKLKPFRVLRKRMATGCLFIVITTIILGMQVYSTYNPFVTIILIALAGIFTLRVNKSLIKFGWL